MYNTASLELDKSMKLIIMTLFLHNMMAYAKTMECNHFPPLKIEKSLEKPGIDVELLQVIFKQMGEEVNYEFLPWKRALLNAYEGKSLGLCSCSYTKDREKDLYFSDPIGTISVGIYTLSKSSDISTIKDLNNLSVGVVRGYNLEKELQNHNINIVTVGDNDSLIEMLNINRVNAIYAFKKPIEYILKKKQIANNFQYTEFRKSEYFACFSKKFLTSDEFVKKFNSVLKKVKSDGRYNQILSKYKLEN